MVNPIKQSMLQHLSSIKSFGHTGAQEREC